MRTDHPLHAAYADRLAHLLHGIAVGRIHEIENVNEVLRLQCSMPLLIARRADDALLLTDSPLRDRKRPPVRKALFLTDFLTE